MAGGARFHRAANRFTQAVQDTTSGVRIVTVQGTITDFTGGLATVQIGSDTLVAPYRKGYTPTVGDTVEVRLQDGSPLIQGAKDGFLTL